MQLWILVLRVQPYNWPNPECIEKFETKIKKVICITTRRTGQNWPTSSWRTPWKRFLIGNFTDNSLKFAVGDVLFPSVFIVTLCVLHTHVLTLVLNWIDKFWWSWETWIYCLFVIPNKLTISRDCCTSSAIRKRHMGNTARQIPNLNHSLINLQLIFIALVYLLSLFRPYPISNWMSEISVWWRYRIG